MNLRFSNQEIRIRVEQTEFEKLLQGEALREQIFFPNSRELNFKIQAVLMMKENEAMSVNWRQEGQRDELELQVAFEALGALATQAPKKEVALFQEMEVPDHPDLKLRFEIDLFSIKAASRAQTSSKFPGRDSTLV